MFGENVGSIEYDARIKTSQLRKDASEADNIARSTGDTMGSEMERGASRGSAALDKFAKAAKYAAVAVGAAIGYSIVRNVDDAVKRIDTLNNSARTFENMGFKAADADKAMSDLTKSILGLPTPLDSAVRGMTALAATYSDVALGQKVFTSLNNAILGFGGTTDMVDNAILQLSQRPMDGPLDAQTWNSLLQSGLTPVLVAMAKESGTSVGAMKEAFGDGVLTVKDFTDRLVKMNEQGGGGLKSLEQIAKDSTKGISTSYQNMQTAITRGLANILKVIGPENIAGTITKFGMSMEGALKSVALYVPKIVEGLSKIGEYLGPKLAALGATIRDDVLPAVVNLAKAFGPALGAGLVGFIGLTTDALNVLLTVLGPFLQFLSENTWIVWGVVGAFVAFKTALAIESAVAAFKVALVVLNGAMIQSGGVAGGLRLAMLGVLGPWQIVLGIAGVAAVVYGIKEVAEWLDKLLNKWDKAKSQDIPLKGTGHTVKAGSDIGLTQRFLQSLMGRASGGPVSAGQAYIVGEKRPELFVPNQSGTILPEVPGLGGGGANINVTVNMAGIMARSKADLRDIGKDIIKVVNDELRAKNATPIGNGALS